MIQKEKIKKALFDSNPWWRQKLEINYKDREIYPKLQKYIEAKQIIALTGLRRVGKTTIMLKIAKEKIDSGFASGNIVYFSFDNFRDLDLSELLEAYSEEYEKNIENSKYLFLFDEIQKINNWEEQVKRLYDLHANFKIIISGSESLFIRKKSKESLAGRMFEFKVESLSFREYLSFKGLNLKPVGLSRRVVSLYIGYLENSFLIKKIFNFSRNQRKTARKLKKYYPTIPALGFIYGNED